MLKLLVEAMYQSTGRTINALSLGLLVRSKSGLPTQAFQDATDLATAGMTIANVMPIHHRTDLRGAVIDALTEAFLSTRAAVLVEVDVTLSNGTHLNRQDLAVDRNPVEVYECKSAVSKFDQGDVDDFVAMVNDAASTGGTCIAAVATLASRYELALVLQQLTVSAPIFSAAIDDILDLMHDRPLMQVAP